MIIDVKPIIAAVVEFNNQWIKKHGTYDFGSCGAAAIYITFGRKITLRKALQAEGFIGADAWTMYGQKGYTVQPIRVENDLSIQNDCYFRERGGVIATEVNKQLAETGAVAHCHSWVD